jgi:hypothetical protein
LAKINEDGSIDVFFGPNEPEQKGNWIKTVPGKARSQSSASTVLSEPFVDKSWVLNDIEEANHVRVPQRITRCLFMARSGQICAVTSANDP